MKANEIVESAVSRRTFLAAGAAVGTGLFLSRRADAGDFPVKEYDIATNGISLHVTEQGDGAAVLFVHGFPDTSYTWQRQMKAVAAAGYRAIAPDMRGYGGSSAPTDASVYTPLHTAGDLVGLLDALKISNAVLVGHDWGASHAWSAALMRPEADQLWSDAAVTIPGVLYWGSGSAPADERWHPLKPARSAYRPAPGPLPSWAEPDYVAHNISEFKRTGFHGGLNYYRAYEPYFYLSAGWKGAKITQPSFYMVGKVDGLHELFPVTAEQLRPGLPGLAGMVELDGVGHWVHHEASAQVSEQLVKFLRSI